MPHTTNPKNKRGRCTGFGNAVSLPPLYVRARIACPTTARPLAPKFRVGGILQSRGHSLLCALNDLDPVSERQMTSQEIRKQFIDFFRGKEHEFVPSSPVVPYDDPTLMFANAGMNQFKPIFLGTVDRQSSFARLRRAVNTQKCIRAGGKHNDLDDVGQDTYHHTFFEMLGNWSFGDYFKKEAIAWAWELLTEVWGIDKSRLHATYFGGLRSEPLASTGAALTEQEASRGLKPAAQGESVGCAWELEPDYESRDLWASVTDIDPAHIHPGNMKDNFWEMGETGPCGPCSEIHIDLTPDKSGASLVNKGDARVIELWNLVFIQLNRAPDRKLSPLPAKHVDTGMGFERICAVLQGMERGKLGSTSNYDTDVFTPIFDAIQKRTGVPDYTATLPTEPQALACATPAVADGAQESELSNKLKSATPVNGDKSQITNGRSRASALKSQIMIDVSYRVIADHLRCLTFALTDGATPSNEGRGYVLRRILRRAVRYGRQYMNMHEPFLCDLVEPLVEHMSDVFPELRTGPDPERPIENVKHVADILRDEEASFLKTLDRGIKLFNEAAAQATRHHHGTISGEDAFKLHDTYGFPIDLTELMAEERRLTIDIGEYERLMEEARVKARNVVALSGSARARLNASGTLSSRVTTDDSGKYTLFECDGEIAGAVVEGQILSTDPIGNGTECAVALGKTCFYSEQGGQVGDRGVLETDTGRFEVRDTQRVNQTVIHIGIVTDGEICSGQRARLRIDRPRRLSIMKNHTATHLLNWALREVLCEPQEREHPHVQQKGSLVDPEKTRFDFSHNKPVTPDELERIEALVNQKIKADLTVYTREVNQETARKINTLRAVFGEKYPDVVRVVSIGVPIDQDDAESDSSRAQANRVSKPETLLGNPKNPEWMNYSVEFCGGTHVAHTKEIEAFVLTEESGVAKGVRRVVGVSGKTAQNAIATGRQLLEEINTLCPEPQASACATLTKVSGSNKAEAIGQAKHPRPGRDSCDHADPVDLGARVAAFQAKVNDAVIPIGVRNTIREQLAELQKVLKEQQKHAAAASCEAVMDRVRAMLDGAVCGRDINGVTVVVGEVPAAPPDALRGAIDWIRNKTDASAVLLTCINGDKVVLLAGMSKAVVKRGVRAGDLIKEIAPLVGGKGGGRPDMAQGGGTNVQGLEKALAHAKDWIREKLQGVSGPA